MSNEISLQATERKIFKSAFQDGLIDIGIGIYILMFPIILFLGTYLGDFWSSAVLLPVGLIAIFGVRFIRKSVIAPRVGTVKYGSWRKSRMIRFNVFMMFLLTFALILGILSAVQFDVVPGWIHTARFSLVFFISFSVAGYFLDFPRLYLYGVLLALAPLVGEILYSRLGVPHHGFQVTFGIAGTLMIIIGLTLFIRLLRDHPLQTHQEGPQETNP